MGYKKAEEILPLEVIELVQQYIQGQNIYIPRRKEKRRAWGSENGTKDKFAERNAEIYAEYCNGSKTAELAEKYYLSEKSIWRIIRDSKQ